MIDNLLDKLNAKIQDDLLRKKELVDANREALGYTPFGDYFVNLLKAKIVDACGDIPNIDDIELEFIDREMFGGDVAVKIPKLLKEKGSGVYIKEMVPKLTADLQKLVSKEGGFRGVEHKGIYVNILLDNKYLFDGVWQAVKMGDHFGQSDVFRKKTVVVDYSSPNVAKHLHAGHIRSTIIGEVLCNIYQAVGYTVHRLNYINDWGGMGFLIEGYERWTNKLPKFESKNSELYGIYQIYRRGEKLSGSEQEFNLLTPSASDELAIYFGEFGSFAEFKDRFNEFKISADKRFKNLEKGYDTEFTLWQHMRDWSLQEFREFYEMIFINHDYLLGESFYAGRAMDLVEDRSSSGEVVLFTEALAEDEINYLERQREDGELTQEELERLRDGILGDVGASVVILNNHKRFLVRKSNGSTLYATRDLASIEHRISTFDPARLVYEVGEEQTEYFKNLFEASSVLNFDENHSVGMTHAAHGFYIDSATGKKLASREGAASVMNLVGESIKYFRTKYDARDDGSHKLTDMDKDKNAHKLAVGSITFNDIKQDKRFPISLDKDTGKTIKIFEESGGAYVMYSLARARSIIRKSEVVPESAVVGTEDHKDMTEDEIKIMKEVANFPLVILRSAIDDNPATLALFLLTLANDYNGYYERSKVLEGGKLLYPHRLLITAAVATVLSNGLKICHAEAPEII